MFPPACAGDFLCLLISRPGCGGKWLGGGYYNQIPLRMSNRPLNIYRPIQRHSFQQVIGQMRGPVGGK